MGNEKVYGMSFAKIYPLLMNKAVKKGRTSDEVNRVVCGIRVEEVDEPLMQEIRYLDKLIDELAKGKAMEKILRGIGG